MTTLTRSLWPSTLEKRGVELVDREAALHGNIQLQCKKCGKSWEPRLQVAEDFRPVIGNVPMAVIPR